MTEEMGLAVAAAVAGIFLLAGLVQALSIRPRRRRRVRRPGARAPARRRPSEPAPPALAAQKPSPSTRRAPPAFTPRSRPATAEAPPPAGLPSPAEPSPAAAAPPTAAPPAQVGPPSGPSVVAPKAPGEETARAAPAPRAPATELPLDDCLALYERRQYKEIIATAEPALQRALAEAATSPPRADEVARLWSVLALSRQALGDEEGARSAFEEAIHVAPEDDRPSYRGQMVALVASVSRRLLAQVEAAAAGAGEEQIRQLKQAMLWLDHGLAEAPGEAELASALERARHGLWAAYNRAVTALIQRQEFHRARRFLREALADQECPVDRRSHFMELLSTTYTGEIGQLTASAIRTLEDEREREALSFLQRAETILSTVPPEVLTPRRREDVNRRLWWGYTKLGMRRVEAGECEAALEPLFHALEIGEVDPERQQETRQALVRALESVADSRGAAITRLAKEGDRNAAVGEVERLKSLMRESLERGLTQQELSSALSKARRVMEWLERGSAG